MSPAFTAGPLVARKKSDASDPGNNDYEIRLASGSRKLAVVFARDGDVRGETGETEANATLYAAAPDLYAAAAGALKALVGIDEMLHRHGMMQGVACPAIEPLRAALSRASLVQEKG